MGAASALDDRPDRLELTSDGLPARLEWHRRLYEVTDAPTPLQDALGALLTHPLPVTGWRFQGTAVGGDARVFDVLLADGGWRVIKTWR